MQREGLSVSVDEKMRIAARLGELGIHIIEGGFPGSNPKDAEFFSRMQGVPIGGAVMAAFGTTRARGAAAEDDVVLRVLAESWVPISCIVGKTWDLHIQKVLRVDRAENLRMIAESVAFLRGQGKRVVYDAEHFFDAHAAHPEYALQCVRVAAEAGAETIVLCDTNGATTPPALADVVRSVVAYMGGVCRGRHPYAQRRGLRRRQLARWPSRRGSCTCRAPSTATASGAATPTCAASSRRSS